MTALHIVFLFFSTLLASLAATGLMLRFLRRRGIVDTPNERSSHETPIPRGGGLAVMVVLLAAWGLSLGNAVTSYQWLFIATVFVGLVSWIDDLRNLSAAIRLASQFIAVGGVLWLLPSSSLYFHGIFPLWLDNLIAAFLWVWFINLFNFMDGIDGIAGVEAVSIGLGVFLLTMIGAAEIVQGKLGLIIAATAFGFLWWNWQPAKIFLGDVGSVALGFLLGWLLLKILASPVWPAAIILPLYYLVDATLTLIHRAIKGERVWQAHRQHYYQHAVQRGLSHAHVSLIIAVTNVVLIGLAYLAITYPLPSVFGAIVVVGISLFYMRGSKTAP